MTVKKSLPEPFASVTVTAPLQQIGKWVVFLLPEEESVKFSSRGQVSVTGELNGYTFNTVLEPDGRWSHWFKVDALLQKEANVKAGDEVSVTLTQVGEWPEPIVPTDFVTELAAAPASVQRLWGEITPMARWEWIRWVNATRDQATRKRRVEVSMSKMKSGKRRPCCFNLAACTDPDLSRSGRLMASVAT